MKILKILLILLVPALGIVGCKKSESKPCQRSSSASSSQSNTPGSKSEVQSEEGGQGTDVVGSGDDDRDGGDKRIKKAK